MHSRMLLPLSLAWLTCLIAQTATGQILEQNLELFLAAKHPYTLHGIISTSGRIFTEKISER